MIYRLLFSAVAFALTSLTSTSVAYPIVDELVKKLAPTAEEGGWTISSDWRSVTLIREKTKLLNPFGLPALTPEDELWDEYGFETAFRITITFEPKLKDSEYTRLKELKALFLGERTQGEDGRGRLAAASKAERLFQIPKYKTERFSVYIYSSRNDFFDVRLATAWASADKMLKIIDDTFESYPKP